MHKNIGSIHVDEEKSVDVSQVKEKKMLLIKKNNKINTNKLKLNVLKFKKKCTMKQILRI